MNIAEKQLFNNQRLIYQLMDVIVTHNGTIDKKSMVLDGKRFGRQLQNLYKENEEVLKQCFFDREKRK